MVSVRLKPHTSQPPTARFGGEVPIKIKNQWLSDKLYNVFSHTADLQIEKFNLSLNDWASKICIFFALDIPQSYIAFKKKAHKWETMSRNVIVTLTGLIFTIFTKADKYSLNGFLNIFMKPKYKPGEFPSGLKGVFAKAINWLRPGGDYYKIFEYMQTKLGEKDRKKAFWSSLDMNYLEKIEKIGKELQTTASTDLEKALKETIPAFIRRYKVFSTLATAFVSAFTIYLIGEMALKLAFRFFAPWDPDWTPAGDLSKSAGGAEPAEASPAQQPVSRHTLAPKFIPYLPYARTIQLYPPMLTSTMPQLGQRSRFQPTSQALSPPNIPYTPSQPVYPSLPPSNSLPPNPWQIPSYPSQQLVSGGPS